MANKHFPVLPGHRMRISILLFLWLLLKGTPPDGIYNASDTRPPAGINTDAKVFAMALAARFNSMMSQWAIAAQRGFIRGRQMLQNVIDIETSYRRSCFSQ